MALFKIFKGSETDLNSVPCHEGYAYFTEDTGNLFIDVSSEPGGRLQVNSLMAKELYNKEDPQNNLEAGELIDRINSSTTTANTITLEVSSWQASGEQFTYSVNITGLICGKNGDVPPLISCISNIDDYSKIISADVTPAEDLTQDGVIQFLIAEMPTNNIELIVIDNK